ncbi:hypothetical protein F5X68DRAFT_242557 [Plectosphaerella plurivora]|uniref:Uncharacterized protein n=1 Tax=Plectosphaerella plurivora TaxID=936078 RepID=A0A9P9A939_9PEZI|nr:hypothetical protein F5X68DRAFT_242557 [Plectosphaerella plurivora]
MRGWFELFCFEIFRFFLPLVFGSDKAFQTLTSPGIAFRLGINTSQASRSSDKNTNMIEPDPDTISQTLASHRPTHNNGPPPELSRCLLTVAFFVVFFLIIAFFVLDALRPDAFTRKRTRREQRILAEVEAQRKAKKGERTPLIQRERPADEEEARRPPPFWPQAKLSPWSVRYYDPDGRQMDGHDVDSLLTI